MIHSIDGRLEGNGTRPAMAVAHNGSFIYLNHTGYPRELFAKMSLKVNNDIKSRITYSSTLLKLNPDYMEAFVMAQLDAAE